MSTRIDDGPRGALLAEDDDWFATARQQATEVEDPPWENDLEWQLRDPAPPDLGRRQGAIVLAVVAAVFLVAAGILIGRETKSSTTKVVTVAAASQAQEASAATGSAADNSAATSTPTTGTSTPSSSASTPTTGTGTSTPSVGTSTPTSSAVPTDATLRPGDKGAAVISLQKALITLGYAPGTADGTYGATTAQAVAAFQTARSLTADGLAGAKTLAAINAALASG